MHASSEGLEFGKDQADLVEIEYQLRALANYQGTSFAQCRSNGRKRAWKKRRYVGSNTISRPRISSRRS